MDQLDRRPDAPATETGGLSNVSSAPEPQAVLAPLTEAAIMLVLTVGAGGEETTRAVLADLSSSRTPAVPRASPFASSSNCARRTSFGTCAPWATRCSRISRRLNSEGGGAGI